MVYRYFLKLNRTKLMMQDDESYFNVMRIKHPRVKIRYGTVCFSIWAEVFGLYLNQLIDLSLSLCIVCVCVFKSLVRMVSGIYICVFDSLST